MKAFVPTTAHFHPFSSKLTPALRHQIPDEQDTNKLSPEIRARAVPPISGSRQRVSVELGRQ